MAWLIVCLSFLLLVLVALWLPVEVELRAGFHGKPVFRQRLRLFHGLLTLEMGEGKGKSGRAGDSCTVDSAGNLVRFYRAAEVPGVADKAWRTVGKLWHQVEVRHVSADLSVSLGDDYYSGMLMAFAIPVVLYLDGRFGGRIALRPAFEEDLLLEGDVSAVFRARPLKLLAPCLHFALSSQFRQSRRIWKGNW